MDELPPTPWFIDHRYPGEVFAGKRHHPWLTVARAGRDARNPDAVTRRIVAAVNATADPAVLALAEHLNAMDPGQRGAAMDQIKHAIGGEW